jgi:hypothetical protein|tara:strand:- start:354 stop:902 length:549 start_codon:yes stop_codon:yes gene_type:complete
MNEHVVVSSKPGRYHGWPANNGIWSWGDEILVGFTQADYVQQTGHSIDGVQENHLAKSLDGGQTWHAYRPEGYFRDENQKYHGGNKQPVATPLNFLDPGLVSKVFSQGYHGTEDPVRCHPLTGAEGVVLEIADCGIFQRLGSVLPVCVETQHKCLLENRPGAPEILISVSGETGNPAVAAEC